VEGAVTTMAVNPAATLWPAHDWLLCVRCSATAGIERCGSFADRLASRFFFLPLESPGVSGANSNRTPIAPQRCAATGAAGIARRPGRVLGLSGKLGCLQSGPSPRFTSAGRWHVPARRRNGGGAAEGLGRLERGLRCF